MTTQRVKSFITAAFVSLAGSAACIPASYATALYEYDVTITGGNLSGHGSIGFNALTGNSAVAPALENFFFSVDGLNGAPAGQLPRVFNGVGDISSIAWSINPTTLALQLTLDTLTQTDKGKSWDLSIDTTAPLVSSVTCGTTVTGSDGNLACYSQNRNQLASGSGVHRITRSFTRRQRRGRVTVRS